MRAFQTFFIVLRALVVTFKRIFSPNILDSTRFCWTLGSQVRRVLCFEKGTLFPESFVLPWKRPSWERLKGLETISQSALLGNMANAKVRNTWVSSKLCRGICDYLYQRPMAFVLQWPNRSHLITQSLFEFLLCCHRKRSIVKTWPWLNYLSMRCSCTATCPTTDFWMAFFIRAFVYLSQN